ncbi:uncharacterized protein LOC101859625 [Aplysia californica]|uniref:Uncharacterized protein LOC101859625 n=1 Tax=Aplysia californica TaxID=6500 RepID=A0ABM0ZUU5_APLCA|nr:uncharacterized protein LOC101859625 [Aplysia californica]
MCYNKLAPTLCRKFCNLCHYPALSYNNSIPTQHPPPATAQTNTSAATGSVTNRLTTAPTTPSQPASTTTATPSCVDHFKDCATAPSMCQNPYASTICKATCNYCPVTTVAPAPCTDHLTSVKCTDIPNVCLNVLAPVACPKTCGIC